MIEILIDSLRNAFLVSGLVVIMMMLIESLSLGDGGTRLTSFFSRSKFAQVLLGSALGTIPGCMGGFATVSLYTHGMLSFGALVAMMIASSGDEAFVMMAMIPDKAPWIFGGLFLVAVVAGLLTDVFFKREHRCCTETDLSSFGERVTFKGARTMNWKRVVMIVSVLVFCAALVLGWLEHEEGHEMAEVAEDGFNFLSEEWMYWMFAVLGLLLIALIAIGSDSYIEHHYWHHIIVHHLPKVFAWTFGTLIVLGCLTSFVDVAPWINDNVVLMIILAAAIGMIPESGPHLIFVSLYASGTLPLAVLIASCISQDGHAGLPLLAEDRRSFFIAKALNFALAIALGLLLI